MVKRLNETTLRTEKEIDRLYPGQWVLVDEREFPTDGKGYIIAIADDTEEERDELIAIMHSLPGTEYRLMCGCPNRGSEVSLGLQLSGAFLQHA